MGFFTKPAEKNKGVETDKWKDKYLNLLDAHEQFEKAHKEQQELLCKIVIRLSLAASGVDPQLEPCLQRIRDHLKKGIDCRQLKTDLENFTHTLYQLKDSSPKELPRVVDISLLFEFLQQRYTSSKQQKDLARLRASSRSLNDPQRLFSEIVSIIESEPTDIKIAKQHSGNTSSLIQHSIDSSFVSAQLLKLLEKIEIPDAFTQKIQCVKQQLKTLEAPQSFESIIDSVISLLIEINTHKHPKQEEIDKFLAQIAEQLTALGLAFSDSNNAFIDTALNRNKFDQSVCEQISDLHHQSIQATQLEPLKRVISSRIDKITQEIQEHKQKEAIALEKYQQQMEKLNQKIKAMEMETTELKSNLATASSRALRDPLTGLPNRLAYDERLSYEIAHWQRYHTPLCLIVWDIDFFKKINDKFGHQIGDKVLAHVARQLSENIRKTDFIARIGGEEFVMLMPDTKKLPALQKADYLRAIIEQNQLNLNNTTHCITLSCGITEFTNGDTYELAFTRADQALYQAKKRGRNRCCMG
ncbi:MAG: GGDEF domain-containing protein [Methylomicrobium sp.]